MPKDWDEYSPWKQDKLARELGEQFNIDRDKYQEQDRGSQGNFDRDGYNQAISDAMANDYDTRRAMEAARLSGDYDGPSGISNMGEAYKVHNFMKDTHEKNGGGRFSSDNDYAGVANYYVNKDRDSLMDDINGMKDSLLEQALGQKKAKEEEEEEYVPSNRAQNAMDRLEEAANNPVNLYEKSNEPVAKSNDQKDGARNFFDNTKLNLAQGLNLQEQQFDNLTNAANFTESFYQ